MEDKKEMENRRKIRKDRRKVKEELFHRIWDRRVTDWDRRASNEDVEEKKN